MTQSEKRFYLISELIKEDSSYSGITISKDENEQKSLLRALFNMRMPKPVSKEFLNIQDEYLKEEIRKKGVTDFNDLKPVIQDIYLWQGDITTLKCDAIVNAANSGMLGCFFPNHMCIDNAIHTYAGVQLRLACNNIMQRQGYKEKTGNAKITQAYNLPCRYIIHTVGPIVKDNPTKKDCELLKSCYYSCLKAADENHINSIAFCCISTGEFNFCNETAAQIAVDTVKKYKAETQSKIKVIFNVFKDLDLRIYRKIFG